jgi:hypothetical protein
MGNRKDIISHVLNFVPCQPYRSVHKSIHKDLLYYILAQIPSPTEELQACLPIPTIQNENYVMTQK